jgi:hypothetical protein
LPNLLAGFQLAGRERNTIREYFEPRQKKQLPVIAKCTCTQT